MGAQGVAAPFGNYRGKYKTWPWAHLGPLGVPLGPRGPRLGCQVAQVLWDCPKEADRLKKMEAMINNLTEQQNHLIGSLNVTNK